MGAHNVVGITDGKATDPESPQPAKRQRRDGYDREDALQEEAASFLTAALPEDSWWCHIPNQGMYGSSRHTLIAGAKFKRQGLKAGAPDNLIIHAGRAYFIELKARYGSLSDVQQVVIPQIEAAGVPVAVCRTLDEIELALNAWGIPLQRTLEEYRAPRRAVAAGWKAALQERMSAVDYQRLAKRNRGGRKKS